jgi:hypothetical protein
VNDKKRAKLTSKKLKRIRKNARWLFENSLTPETVEAEVTEQVGLARQRAQERAVEHGGKETASSAGV